VHSALTAHVLGVRRTRLEEASTALEYFVNPASFEQDVRLKRVNHPMAVPGPPEAHQPPSSAEGWK
jgi:hypothetical protein